MERFWLCIVQGTDGGYRVPHYSLEEAEIEAGRLAQLPNVKGKPVYLLECIGKCQIVDLPVRWERPY